MSSRPNRIIEELTKCSGLLDLFFLVLRRGFISLLFLVNFYISEYPFFGEERKKLLTSSFRTIASKFLPSLHFKCSSRYIRGQYRFTLFLPYSENIVKYKNSEMQCGPSLMACFCVVTPSSTVFLKKPGTGPSNPVDTKSQADYYIDNINSYILYAS